MSKNPSIDRIARSMKRTRGAIEQRLVRIGRIGLKDEDERRFDAIEAQAPLLVAAGKDMLAALEAVEAAYEKVRAALVKARARTKT